MTQTVKQHFSNHFQSGRSYTGKTKLPFLTDTKRLVLVTGEATEHHPTGGPASA